jgi:hypothetical protein
VVRTQPSVEDFSAVLRYDHRVVLALPPHMGQSLPLVHKLFLPAPSGLPGRRSLCHFLEGMHAGSLEALRVARPEAVGLERTNLPINRGRRNGSGDPSGMNRSICRSVSNVAGVMIVADADPHHGAFWQNVVPSLPRDR